MSYIELINEFWKQNGFMPFSAIDTKLYFYLLHQCHIRGGHNPFQLQTRDIEFNLSITRKQIGESKNRLKHRGLIDFTSGSRKEAPTYTIIGLGEDMFPEETYVETQIETYPETYPETKQKEIPLKEIPPLNPLKKYTPKKNPPTPTKKISPTRTPEELVSAD